MAPIKIHYDDDTESSEEVDDFKITPEEAQQLHDFLAHEYVSHEFFPFVINIARRLRAYVED